MTKQFLPWQTSRQDGRNRQNENTFKLKFGANFFGFFAIEIPTESELTVHGSDKDKALLVVVVVLAFLVFWIGLIDTRGLDLEFEVAGLSVLDQLL